MANLAAAPNIQAQAVAAFLTSIAIQIAQHYGVTVSGDTQGYLYAFILVAVGHACDVYTGQNVSPAAVTPPPAPPQENKPSAQ